MQPDEILKHLQQRIAKASWLPSLATYLVKAGAKITYATLLLYHSYQSDGTPSWAKRTILGSIAYLIAPLDLIPDLTPFLGFSDDFGVLMFGLVSIAGHITPEIRLQARDQMGNWFPNLNSEVFEAVDTKL